MTKERNLSRDRGSSSVGMNNIILLSVKFQVQYKNLFIMLVVISMWERKNTTKQQMFRETTLQFTSQSFVFVFFLLRSHIPSRPHPQFMNELNVMIKMKKRKSQSIPILFHSLQHSMQACHMEHYTFKRMEHTKFLRFV